MLTLTPILSITPVGNSNTIKMKATLFIVLILSSVVSCKIDNYAEPHLTLSGKISDAQTNELVPSSGSNAGTIIKLYEGSSAQPLLYNTEPDGTFKNSRVFPASYRIVAEGAFDMAEDTIKEKITGDEQIEIKVTPNVRLKLKLISPTDTTAKVTVTYNKVNTKQEIVKLGVVWSTFQYPNATVFPEGDIILNDVSSAHLTNGDETYTVTGLKAGTTYYMRALALTNNAGAYYNYSTQLEVTTQ
jgi:hypothetical protein